MSIPRWVRSHRAFVWMTTVFVVILGARAALRMPSAIYPEVEFPRIVVVARTGGSPPDVYLTVVTRPLEQALTSVLGIQRIRSKTIRGATEIGLQFAPGTDMWRALQMVQSKVAESRSSLPADSEIVVERVTTGSFPVLTLNVAGLADTRDLREVADFVLRPALAAVSGVGRVEVLGGDTREIEIIVDPERAAALHLSVGEIASRLRAGTGLSAVGRLERDRQLVTVLSDSQPHNLEDILAMPVASSEDGSAVTLGSLAEVVEGAEDRSVRIGGPRGETVSLSVARLPFASTTDVVRDALAAVARLSPSLPAGLSVDPVYDQNTLVAEAIASVRDAILLGIVLCSVVIALFLKDARAGFLSAIAVPITLAGTFALMSVLGQTLNLMSLGGMAIAIGLIVDDAIVIIEAIALRRQSGAAADEAAEEGTRELGPAVIGTTLTTVVVFIPLAFLEGIVGDFFRSLALSVTIAVILSLVVALVLVPLVRVGSAKSSGRAGWRDRLHALLLPLSRRPRMAALAYVAILAAGAAVFPFVQKGFLPTMDEGSFVIDYFLPAGTSLATTEAYARQIEHELQRTDDILTFTRRTGAELGPAAATQLNRGDIMVRLVPRSSRHRAVDEVIADVRARLESTVPEARIEFVQVLQDMLNDLSGAPRPIEIKLAGPDYDTLTALGETIATKLQTVPGVVDVYAGHEREVPELRFEAKRDVLARLGVSADTLTTELQTALLGSWVGAVRRGDRLVRVRARYPNVVRFSEPGVSDMPLVVGEQTSTFRAAMTLTSSTSASERMHEALGPLVAVTADHEGRDLGSISSDVDALLAGTPLPPGYRAVLGGQIESQRETTRHLASIFVVSLLLVLAVLAAQFRRLRLSLLVLSSVPIALVGALSALLVTATPLNASSLMGLVLLVGLVVKNGVLLLEEAEKRFDAGASGHAAVAAATERRIRPVLMTTVATLAGLLPLALGIGAGSELQRPLAIAVIGGLFTSTLATLAILPAVASWALARIAPLDSKPT